jgi:GNAT superfamily N-acetyltransferase
MAGPPGPAAGAPVIVPWAAPHRDDVRRVIGAVFAEYAMTFEPDGFDADVRDIGGHYLEPGGAFWVLVDGGRVVGTVGVLPQPDRAGEIKRLYLLPGYRGRGYGRALIDHVLAWARARGCRAVVAWSDVRLGLAHTVYERLGFERFGERTLNDADRSHEIGFRKRLAQT